MTTAQATISTRVPLEPDDAIAALFFSDDGLDDPAPLYRDLRRAAPQHRLGDGATFLTRFDDCQHILRNGAFGKPDRDRRAQMLPGANLYEAVPITVTAR